MASRTCRMSRILTQNSLATELMLAVPSSMFIARTTRERSSLWRCRMYTMSSSRTALYIFLRSPYANRHSVVAIGTFISIRYTPSVCSTSTLPKVCRMPNAGSGTQTIRGQRQRLPRYSQRHKNSGKEEICRRNGKGQSGRNSGRNS